MKLSKEQIGKIIGIAISFLLALLAVFGYDVGVIQPRERAQEAPVSVQSRSVGDTNFTNLVASGTVSAGTGLTVTSGGAVITSGGLAVATGQVDVGDWLNLSAASAISVTAGAIITPTATYQPIESAAAVATSTTLAVANGAEAGDLLILRNTNASDVITVDGTGANVECKADVALGAGDTLWLIWDGSDWDCLSGYDNS